MFTNKEVETAKKGLLDLWNRVERKIVQKYGSDYFEKLVGIAEGTKTDPAWVARVGALTRKEIYLNLAIDLAERSRDENRHIREYAVFGAFDSPSNIIEREFTGKRLSVETVATLEGWRKNLQLDQVKNEAIHGLHY